MDNFLPNAFGRGLCLMYAGLDMKILAIFFIISCTSFQNVVMGDSHSYLFNVQTQNVTRLCTTQTIVTVNGLFPGPTISVRQGDSLAIQVVNNAPYNISIHWHGIRQLLSGWADGPAYITQCPIAPGNNYTYRFNITGQEGTLWWHAHISWLRATVYGALIIKPKIKDRYPFAKQPTGEFPILLGEWWNANVEDVIAEANRAGGAPNISDAFTINGQPGDLYACSKSETTQFSVGLLGGTYLLRIINAAMNQELFFSVAGHNLTVVAVDAVYTKPYSTEVIMITPGQTVDALLTTSLLLGGPYYMGARPYSSAPGISFNNGTTTAVLNYPVTKGSPRMPNLPAFNDTATATTFTTSLRSLANNKYPSNVPQTVDQNLLFTIGLGLRSCPAGQTCAGPFNTILAASMNNVSFSKPDIALLEAHHSNINGVFTTDFPANPPNPFDYTGLPPPLEWWQPELGTRVYALQFNSTVQLVLQDTSILTVENHPIHLHGFNCHIVGQGFGNYNPETDPQNFNLVDPVERNTFAVPVGGWAALRFRADNPGVWFVHCHLEVHTGWGLSMAFLIQNGNGTSQSLPDPPPDLPRC